METTKIGLLMDGGFRQETHHYLEDGTKLIFSHNDDGTVRDDFHVRFRPPGARRDHITAVSMSNPDPMWDPVAQAHLSPIHAQCCAATAMAYCDDGMKPVAAPIVAEAAAEGKPVAK